MNILDFSPHTKECWKKLSQRIEKDELIDINRVMKKFEENNLQVFDASLCHYASIIHYCLANSVEMFKKVLSNKLKKFDRNNETLKDVLDLIKTEEI